MPIFLSRAIKYVLSGFRASKKLWAGGIPEIVSEIFSWEEDLAQTSSGPVWLMTGVPVPALLAGRFDRRSG